jgi:metallo-beta-lactamase class B
VRLPLRHLALVALIAIAVFVGGVLYPMWRQAVDTNRDARADPHHIAGSLYFVGDPAQTSFLLVGDKGHVLIGTAGQDAAHKIADNIEKLGFAITDVNVLLAAGSSDSVSAVQQATGAELWASDASADVLASGGAHDPRVVYLPYKLMTQAGVTTYPPARVDHRVKDNETLRLGSLAVTAHVISAFCTTWTFTVRDRDRDLHVVYRCGLELPYGASLVDPQRPPAIRTDFERTLAALRNLPVDIWLTPQGREYGRFRKYQESLKAEDPAAPFIDPDGYRKSIDEAEARFRKLLAEQYQQQTGKP